MGGPILKMQLQSIQETAPGLVGISPRSNIDITVVKALVSNNGTLLCKLDFNRNLSFSTRWKGSAKKQNHQNRISEQMGHATDF